jgi:hypothetical protein
MNTILLIMAIIAWGTLILKIILTERQKKIQKLRKERRYVLKGENENQKIEKDFKRDFPNGLSFKTVKDVVDINYKNKVVSLSHICVGKGYFIEHSLNAENVVRVEKHLNGYEEHEIEKQHPIKILEFEVNPQQMRIHFFDEGGDIKDFMFLVDGVPFILGKMILPGEKSVFEKIGSLALIKDITVTLNNEKFKPTEIKLESQSWAGRRGLFGYQSVGIPFNFPKGKHELVLYIRDKRGNTSAALTHYEF